MITGIFRGSFRGTVGQPFFVCQAAISSAGDLLVPLRPGVQVGPGPDHAALHPPVTDPGARRRDAEVQVAGARVAGPADLAELLAGADPLPRPDGGVDRREVGAVVAHPVVAEHRHRQPAPGGAVVDRRVVAVDRLTASSTTPSVTATTALPQADHDVGRPGSRGARREYDALPWTGKTRRSEAGSTVGVAAVAAAGSVRGRSAVAEDVNGACQAAAPGAGRAEVTTSPTPAVAAERPATDRRARARGGANVRGGWTSRTDRRHGGPWWPSLPGRARRPGPAPGQHGSARSGALGQGSTFWPLPMTTMPPSETV